MSLAALTAPPLHKRVRALRLSGADPEVLPGRWVLPTAKASSERLFIPDWTYVAPRPVSPRVKAVEQQAKRGEVWPTIFRRFVRQIRVPRMSSKPLSSVSPAMENVPAHNSALVAPSPLPLPLPLVVSTNVDKPRLSRRVAPLLEEEKSRRRSSAASTVFDDSPYVSPVEATRIPRSRRSGGESPCRSDVFEPFPALPARLRAALHSQ